MEWLSSIRKAIDLIESNLTAPIDLQQISEAAGIPPLLLQKGFSVMTGYSLCEYIRNRRLYQAALELRSSSKKVIDIALDYGYETPESFTKAFTRFHRATPSQVRSGAGIKGFFPLHITVSISGGNQMDVTIVKKEAMQVIGFQREFSMDDSYIQIPKFWEEVMALPSDAMAGYRIGEYGICIDELPGNRFHYMIAGKYTGGYIPEGMRIYELPAGDYAIFSCIGPLPQALQEVNTQVFTQWLPGNPDYELSRPANVEWYDYDRNPQDPDYHSAIWLPVQKK